MSSERITVEVEGRQLRLSNVDKVLYPDAGFTKGEVIDYYTRVAPTLLPHLAGRPLTVKRYPDGAQGKFFFEKNAPSHTPDWVRTVELPAPGSTKHRETIHYLLVEELATLVWLANLAALELHVPQWQVGPRGGAHDPDLLVVDLDPGAPATIEECAQVAVWIRDALADDGITAHAKTSGSKGMQLMAPISGEQPATVVSAYAKTLAQRLEKVHADLVVSRMTKTLRPGKVLIDWSQNNAAKTTVAPYSLRAREQPTVSAPLTWDEVEAGQPRSLVAGQVLDRLASDGDPLSALRSGGPRVPAR